MTDDEQTPTGPDLVTKAWVALGPGLHCEFPPLTADTPVAVNGDLLVRGYAMVLRGLEQVLVEIETRGVFVARTGVRRPEGRRRFHPALWSRRLGFEALIETDDWIPGTYRLTVTARGRTGRNYSETGLIEWIPSIEQLAAGYPDRAPAIWLGEPRFDGASPCDALISFRGWARGPAGVDSVLIHLEGLEPVKAFSGISIPEIDAEIPADAPPGCAFAAALDTSALPPRCRQVTVTVNGSDGRSSSRSGRIAIDAGKRYRTTLSARRALAPRAATSAAMVLHACIAGDRSDDAITMLAAQTHPIAFVDWVDEGGLGPSIDAFLADPDADVLVFLAAEELLDPNALAAVAGAFAAQPAPDWVYADHDVIDAEARRGDPFVKPGWSPELLLSLDYVGAFVAVGRRAAECAARVDQLQSVRAMTLGFVDQPLRVTRIPEALSSHSDSMAPDRRGEDHALRAVAARRGHELRLGPHDERLRVRDLSWRRAGSPLVSVVIPTTGIGSPLPVCLRSLRERSSYDRLEVVLVDSGRGAAAIAAYALGPIAHEVVRFSESFNFSRACNLGARAASGEFLVFLNDDVEIVTSEWIELMLAHAQLPTTGIVGAKLLFPGGLIQNAGLVLDRLSPPHGEHFVAAAFAYQPAETAGPHGVLKVPRDCVAVTGACAMIEAAFLRELGGWDESLTMLYGDVDLSLRAHEAGRTVIVEPRAVLIHAESTTQGYGVDRYEDDRRTFLARWQHAYPDGDPWYHPRCDFDRDWMLST